MKKLAILIVGIILFVACKNDKKETKTDITPKDDLVLEQEEVVDKLPNLSDINFMASLEAYQQKDYTKSAKFIEDGVAELKKEGANLDAKNKKILNASIAKINNLIGNVKKGEQDLATLTQAFGNAEMLVAHDYFIYTISTLLDEPAKGTYFFSKALRSLNNAVVTLKGKAKEEAKAIQAESKKLATKIKEGGKNLEKDIKAQTDKIKDFLKKHEVAIF